jgi:hypothetical protein
MQKLLYRWSSTSFPYILTKDEEYFKIESKDKVGVLINGDGVQFFYKISDGECSGRLPGKAGDRITITLKNDSDNYAIVYYNFFVKNNGFKKIGFVNWFKRLLGDKNG